MAHFYHFSDDSMENMSVETFQDYWLAIDAIESYESINQIKIASYTSLKKGDRDKMFNGLNKKAKSIFIEKDRAQLSTEDVAKVLARAMING